MPGVKGKRGVRVRRIVNDENTRLKIKTTQIQKRLTQHIFGEIEMSSTQVTAALGLLKKTLPDMQSVEVQAEVETIQRVVSAKPIDLTQWEDEYASGVGTTTGTTESTH